MKVRGMTRVVAMFVISAVSMVGTSGLTGAQQAPGDQPKPPHAQQGKTKAKKQKPPVAARSAHGNITWGRAPLTSGCSIQRPRPVRVRANNAVITEAPAELVEDIWFKPGIWPNRRSSGAVIELVITLGLAPG